ncbi:MAG: hypothetical protein FWD13_03035 [Treponema sp.]|nr:hypothetical protein [Treponema sp.]
MKRTILALILLAGLIAVPAFAQDFESPKPQFFTFNIGVPVGFDIGTNSVVAGTNFGISFVVAEKFEVGFDHFMGLNFVRVAFSFSDILGAAIGYGGIGPNAIIGVYGTFFQARAANGIAYNLGVRLDYMADTSNFSSGGNILVTFRTSFGI